MNSVKQEGKVVKGSFQEIANMLADEKETLIGPGVHNILVYNDLKAFREIYSQYSEALLTENEIVAIASQYDTISNVSNTLRLAGIDIGRYLNQGTLFIIDAQQGYQDADRSGIWKLCKSLISRARKEDRLGVTLMGDLGSFFNFEKIEELMKYELSLPQKYEDSLKGICCYHLKDFEKQSETQQQTTLSDCQFKSILVKERAGFMPMRLAFPEPVAEDFQIVFLTTLESLILRLLLCVIVLSFLEHLRYCMLFVS